MLADIRKVTKRPFYMPPSWQAQLFALRRRCREVGRIKTPCSREDLCGKIFVTCYMASATCLPC